MADPRAPAPAPLYVRLPALALSLGVAGFLVFQAGLPGCGPAPSASPTADPPARPPDVLTPPAAAAAAPAPAPAPVEPAVDPGEAVNANADDSSALLGADTPDNADTRAGDKGNAAPRFFPASKAMVPLIEPGSQGDDAVGRVVVGGPPPQDPAPSPQAQRAADPSR